jgi:hypothetical protein
MSERREFQIRTTDEYGDEQVECFTDLAEANERYYQMLETAQEEGVALEFELVEVLLQDETKEAIE